LSLLREAGDGPAVVVCNTCRVSAEERETPDGVRGGALLASALREIAAQIPGGTGVAIQEMPCLFNCTQHCSIHLRAPGKIGYVLGRFEPTAEAARAILDYAVAYAASDEGVVPYRQWPEGVKGHFIVRIPPAGRLVGE
jgi:predicted metal-binding protein